jgi:CO/xanthine dehydrogenase Mo-binding subunit
VRYDRILEDLLNRDDFLVVGRSVVRTDALDKVLGRAKFTADYVPRDTAVVKVVRSPHPHALIKGIDASPALELPGVHIVLTAADVPGENQIGYALPDQPFLNDVKTRFVGDPVALVVAADEGSAFEGADAVRVKYSPLPPVLDTINALTDGAPLVQEGGNVALTTKIRKGAIKKGFSEAKVVVEAQSPRAPGRSQSSGGCRAPSWSGRRWPTSWAGI